MEHIIQFGVNIDDVAIQKAVVAEAQKQIIECIQRDVEKIVFADRYGRPDKNHLSYYAESLIKETIDAYRDRIIEGVIASLTDKISRTKKFKEAVGEVIDDA